MTPDPLAARRPKTAQGVAAVAAIKSGSIVMWADDPDDPIAAMVRDVEDAATLDATRPSGDTVAWEPECGWIEVYGHVHGHQYAAAPAGRSDAGLREAINRALPCFTNMTHSPQNVRDGVDILRAALAPATGSPEHDTPYYDHPDAPPWLRESGS